MQPRHTRRHLLALVAATALVALSLAISACGGGGSSSGSSGGGEEGGAGNAGVEKAEQRLQEASKTAKWEAPGPKFEASKASGKKVMYIGVDTTIPIVKTVYEALSEAAAKDNVSVTEFDGKGQVSEFNRGIETAVGQHYDAIVLLAIPSELVSGAVAEAKRAGIPVIEAQEHDPGSPLEDGIVGQVTFCYSCAGKLMADYVIADSGAKAESTVFISKEVSNGVDELGGIQSEFKELCPECKMEVDNVPVADWQTKLPTLTQSTLTSNPDTGYLLPLYDGMAIPIVPAVAQAGKSEEVKLASFNATPSVMEMMANEEVVAADVGGDSFWFGWGTADQVFRVLAGAEPVEDENIPLRMFTKENLGSIDISEPEETWYGNVDYKAEYEKLWGLGG
ncbi:MAG TPA: sugar ABC transporter substrate-binding protein [Solirubrobacterales bacterium]|nr:sugar ABC transporter substrate-binding protein [Solirubrobacterales bacterium]